MLFCSSILTSPTPQKIKFVYVGPFHLLSLTYFTSLSHLFYLFPPYFSSMVYIIFLFEFVLRHLIIQYLFLKWLFLLFSFWVPSILILFPLFFSHCGLSFCISDSRQILLEDSYCSFVSCIFLLCSCLFGGDFLPAENLLHFLIFLCSFEWL